MGEAFTTQRLTTADFFYQFFGGGLEGGNGEAIERLQKGLTADACNFGSFGLGNYADLVPLDDGGNQQLLGKFVGAAAEGREGAFWEIELNLNHGISPYDNIECDVSVFEAFDTSGRSSVVIVSFPGPQPEQLANASLKPAKLLTR